MSFCCCFDTVSTSEVGVIESCGKFSRLAEVRAQGLFHSSHDLLLIFSNLFCSGGLLLLVLSLRIRRWPRVPACARVEGALGDEDIGQCLRHRRRFCTVSSKCKIEEYILAWTGSVLIRFSYFAVGYSREGLLGVLHLVQPRSSNACLRL